MQPSESTLKVHARSSACDSGRKHSELSSLVTGKNALSASNSKANARFVSMTPRGSPVVPDV